MILRETELFLEGNLEVNNSTANDVMMQLFPSIVYSPVIYFFKIVIYLLLK